MSDMNVGHNHSQTQTSIVLNEHEDILGIIDENIGDGNAMNEPVDDMRVDDESIRVGEENVEVGNEGEVGSTINEDNSKEARKVDENEEDNQVDDHPKDYSIFPEHGYDFMEDDFHLQTNETFIPSQTETNDRAEGIRGIGTGGNSNTNEGNENVNKEDQGGMGTEHMITEDNQEGEQLMNEDEPGGIKGDEVMNEGVNNNVNTNGESVNRTRRGGIRGSRVRALVDSIEEENEAEGQDDDARTVYGDDDDELRSIASEDENGEVQERPIKYCDFNTQRDMMNPVFRIGMRFATREILKQAINAYSVKQRRKLKYTKKFTKKIRVKCVGNDMCPWKLHASPIQGQLSTWIIKTYVGEHNCGTYNKIGKADHHWVARMYLEKLRDNPTMPVKALVQAVDADHHLTITENQAYLAKRETLEMINGNHLDQYKKIFDYRNEVEAVVEAENRSSWTWFISLLKDDLGIDDDTKDQWAFISDQQKCIDVAMAEIMPEAERRYYVLHLYNNFKKEFKGKELKDLMWNLCKSRNAARFRDNSHRLKSVSQEAFNWLMRRGDEHWCRNKFKITAKCEILLNNVCECFNHFIKNARDKPIISLLDTIMNNIMRRLYMKRDEMKKKCPSHLLCFKIQEKLEKIKLNSSLGIPRWNGKDEYRADCVWGDRHIVAMGISWHSMLPCSFCNLRILS